LTGILVIRNRQRAAAVDARFLRRIALGVLGQMGGSGAFELGIHLVGAREMARLNETHLHHAGATDVLAFDYRGGRQRRARGVPAPKLQGDIVVCVELAMAQARRYRTSWPAEAVRYVIHGLLHLAGHNDAAPAERRMMKRAEDRLLRRIADRFPLRKLARRPRLAS
jgi:probable rRNA maturation factor